LSVVPLVRTGGARRPLSILHDGTTADDLLLMDILWSDPTDRPQTALPSCTSRGSHAAAAVHALARTHHQPQCSRTHARTHACTHARTRSLVRVRAGARRRCAGHTEWSGPAGLAVGVTGGQRPHRGRAHERAAHSGANILKALRPRRCAAVLHAQRHRRHRNPLTAAVSDGGEGRPR
jgi:hypothetical protein